MRYAVAYVNFFDNDLQIRVIDASDPIEAIAEAVAEICEQSIDGVFEWLGDIVGDDPSPDKYPELIEKIQEEFFNTDQLVAVAPV